MIIDNFHKYTPELRPRGYRRSTIIHDELYEFQRNFLQSLHRPRAKRVPEASTREIAMSALIALDMDDATLKVVVSLAASGATPEQIDIYCKLSACGRITTEDLLRLARTGVTT